MPKKLRPMLLLERHASSGVDQFLNGGKVAKCVVD
jgi:hypothetical protein